MKYGWDEQYVEDIRRLILSKLDEILEHGYGDLRIVVSRENGKILIYKTETYLFKQAEET